MDGPAGFRLILAVVFLTAIGGRAAVADCAVLAPAKPVITINAPPVVYDTSMNRAAIKQREMQVNHRGHSEADIVLGTTETEIQPKAQVQISASRWTASQSSTAMTRTVQAAPSSRDRNERG